MNEFTFSSYDLKILEKEDGTKFVAFKNAFEEDFIEAMDSKGVKTYKIGENTDEE